MKNIVYIFFLVFTACGSSFSVTEMYAKGQEEYLKKNLTAAEKIFTDIISEDDGFLNAYLMLAKISYHNRDYDRTLEYLDSILERDPDHSGALYWKGRTLVISGKDENNESEQILNSVLEIDSRNISARLLLALVYEKNGKYKEALHEYITAVNEEESLISARGNLAVLYRRMGLRERAMIEIDRAVRIAEVTGRDIKQLKIIKDEFEKWEEK